MDYSYKEYVQKREFDDLIADNIAILESQGIDPYKFYEFASENPELLNDPEKLLEGWWDNVKNVAKSTVAGAGAGGTLGSLAGPFGTAAGIVGGGMAGLGAGLFHNNKMQPQNGKPSWYQGLFDANARKVRGLYNNQAKAQELLKQYTDAGYPPDRIPKDLKQAASNDAIPDNAYRIEKNKAELDRLRQSSDYQNWQKWNDEQSPQPQSQPQSNRSNIRQRLKNVEDHISDFSNRLQSIKDAIDKLQARRNRNPKAPQVAPPTQATPQVAPPTQAAPQVAPAINQP